MLPLLIVSPAICYILLTLRAASVFFNRRRLPPTVSPEATIIIPVKGADPQSYDNFASFSRQSCGKPQLVFAAASQCDEAVPVIRRLMGNFPDVDIELVLDSRVYGPNYKVCNLINALPMAKHDIIIICDSDVRGGERYLEQMCAPFADPAVGLVTSLYRASSVSDWKGALESLGFSAEMTPNVMAANMLEGVTFALGASMAVRREALESIGGFGPLADYLADDYQLGNRIYRAGYRLELAEGFVDINCSGEPALAFLRRQLRWARTMRVSRPMGFFASGLTLPGTAAVGAVMAGGLAYGGKAAMLLYAFRAVAAILFSRYFVRDGLSARYLWLLPLRDLLSTVNWVMAFTGNRVVWRGQIFRILRGGKMEEVKG